MKISNKPFFRSLEDEIYMTMMVESLKATRVIKPPTTEQAPSTMATLSRDEAEDFKYQTRPLPDNWRAVPTAKTTDEAVGMRALDPIEVSHVEATRRRPKNSIGQSVKSATTPRRRASAIEGFIYSRPAVVSAKEVLDRAIGLVEYKSTPVKEVWVKMPWYKALWHRLKGNQIKKEEANQGTNWRDGC